MRRLMIPFALLLLSMWTAAASEPPFVWEKPAAFDPSKPGMGLEKLPGAEEFVLFKPLPADGSAGYESTRHGTYNHTPGYVLLGDRIVVYWLNHLRDENGPGQRMLARTGHFTDGGRSIEWSDEIAEVAPPAMKPRLRKWKEDGDILDSAAVVGSLQLVGGRIFSRIALWSCDGWTDEIRYHYPPNRKPIPEEHFSEERKKPFTADCYWLLSEYAQEFKLVDGKLVPSSPLYRISGEFPKALQMTPERAKTCAPLLTPYAGATPAPEEFLNALSLPPTQFFRTPKYRPGTEHLTEDGSNGCVHRTEFRRPDGKFVAVRDNLNHPSRDYTYYAAVKDSAEAFYGPAVRTNLFGTAMPVAGELSDGTVWIAGSDGDRYNTFLTWSKDGVRFDRTALVKYAKFNATPGICKPATGGAQYFQSVPGENAVLLLYSIAKEEIAMTRIPLESFQTPPVAFELAEWKKTPRTRPAETKFAVPGLEALYYEGANGKEVFGYLGRPAEKTEPFPAVLLLHGGGGTAFSYWAKLWQRRGYAVLAMDLVGGVPEKNGTDGSDRSIPLPGGGPNLNRVFRDTALPPREQWPYHAIGAAIRGVSLLRAMPGVDPEKIGVVGISWGAVIGEIVLGLDDRLRFGAMVYGCGFLDEDSSWKEHSSPADMQRWRQLWDPAGYLPRRRGPVLFCNGATDKHFRPDSWSKTVALVPEEARFTSLRPHLSHGHPPAGDPPEVALFVDAMVKSGTLLPRIVATEREDAVRIESPATIAEAGLCWTADAGGRPERKWRTIPAKPKDGRLVCMIPPEAAAWFFFVRDERGAVVSGPIRIREGAAK